MRTLLVVVAVVFAAVAAAALPAYGGIVLPPYLAWLPSLLPVKVLAYPAVTFWVAGVLALVVLGFTFIGYAGVALILFLATLWSGLTWFGFILLPPSISFVVDALPWVGLACFIALGLTLRIPS